MSRARSKNKAVITLLIVFIVMAGTVFISLAFFRNLALPKGEITYDSSLNDTEKALVEDALFKFTPKNDVTISATLEDASFLENVSADSYLIYQTLVPVTDFYDETAETTLIPVEQLSPGFKLLPLDGYYYLDDFKNGAKYRVFHFDSKDPAETKDKVSEKIVKNNLSKENVLSFTQTGVTALTRAMLKTLNAVGDGAYFAEYVKDYLSSSDLTHISNEVSFASDCNASADMTLCADPRMFSAITAIGTDIVELTGNHNNDWGKTANLETIKLYHDNDMKTFGGGEDEEYASLPLELSEKGNNITLIGINYSTSSKENGQGATQNTPGANIYNAELTKNQIKSAKEKGDFVIVDIQFSECYSYPDYGMEMPECDLPIAEQKEFFRSMIDNGADMVVGTQAHQPQTYELYHEKPIYYGLGNLFFDQTRWPGTERSLILTHYFKDGKLLQTRVIPTMYGSTYQPQIMDDATREAYLTRLLSASPKGE